MILIVSFLFVVVVTFALPRRPRLDPPSLRWIGVPFAAVVIQVVVINVVHEEIPLGLASTVHVATYVVVGIWALAHLRVPGLAIVCAGGLLNFAAIVTNGGVMPASTRALTGAGIEASAGFANSAQADDAPLWFLGDVFWVPERLPLSNVFSVGDVVLLLGAAVVLSFSRGTTTAAAKAVP